MLCVLGLFMAYPYACPWTTLAVAMDNPLLSLWPPHCPSHDPCHGGWVGIISIRITSENPQDKRMHNRLDNQGRPQQRHSATTTQPGSECVPPGIESVLRGTDCALPGTESVCTTTTQSGLIRNESVLQGTHCALIHTDSVRLGAGSAKPAG